MPNRVLSSPAGSRARREPHKPWRVVLASLGVFMTALDTLVVTTSLPALRVDLHASLQSLEWTVNAYNLAFACLLLTGAALGDRFGRRHSQCSGAGATRAAVQVVPPRRAPVPNCMTDGVGSRRSRRKTCALAPLAPGSPYGPSGGCGAALLSARSRDGIPLAAGDGAAGWGLRRDGADAVAEVTGKHLAAMIGEGSGAASAPHARCPRAAPPHRPT